MDIKRIKTVTGVEVCDNCEYDQFTQMVRLTFNNGTDTIALCNKCVYQVIFNLVNLYKPED